VASITTAQISALGTAQVVALSTSQVQAGLTTDQVVALSTAQVRALTTAQVVALGTSQIAAMETADIAALSTSQVMVLTSSQVAALTTSQITHLSLASPLVLDLNGDGISTQSVSKGVAFDVFGTGQQVNTGWVTGGDGLLVMDRNHDGFVNGGGELFGVGTRLASGDRASDGYAALSELDSNADGTLSAGDADFDELMVWVDSDSDGVSQGSELKSLTDLGISSLNLQAQSSTDIDNGNLIGLVSSYTTTNGDQRAMADVWFATDGPAVEVPALVPEVDIVAEPVELILPPTALVAESGESLADGLATAAVAHTSVLASAPLMTVAEPLASTDLGTQVGGLVDALAAYEVGTAAVGSGAPSLTADTTSLPMTGSNLALVDMVDALKQFDANGQPTMAGVQLVPAAATVTLNGYKPPKNDLDTLAQGQ
jgi:predicted secreted protein